MNLGNTMGVVLCLAAATVGFSSHAGDDRRKSARDHRQPASGMQAVAVAAQAGEPGHGWQYFRDARGGRAVVISPNGDYYYSRGKGLALVYKASTA
jgi:hypothetical protein